MAVPDYPIKTSRDTSHGALLHWLSQRPARTLLDIGCFDGTFGAAAKGFGHTVVGTDLVDSPKARDGLDGFVQADLNRGLPQELSGPYDGIVLADVLEHVLDPDALLTAASERLAPGGEMFLSIPNISHWYPRFKILFGRFDYDDRGPLDRTHYRFFTRTMIEAMIRRAGLTITDAAVVGSPWEILLAREGLSRLMGAADRLMVKAFPQMFGYQFLYVVSR